jgi:hypothetical protein
MEMSLQELFERGIVTEFDNVQQLLPGLDARAPPPSAQLLAGVQIDIAGAAISHHVKKLQKQVQSHKINNQMSQAMATAPRVSNETVLVCTPLDAASIGESVDSIPDSTPVARPRVYEDLQDEFAHQTLLVVRGQIARETPDFESFQRTNLARWREINAVLVKIEEFCGIFGIQFAQVNGRKLGEASRLEVLTHDEVRACLEDVDDFVNEAFDAKARLLQKNARNFLHKLEVNERKKFWQAAFKIQSWWRAAARNQTMTERNLERNELFLTQAESIAEECKPDMVLDALRSEAVTMIHVITSLQDLSRLFFLIYRHVTLILIMPELPPPHIWEDLILFFAHCGIPDVNDRIHFVILRNLNSGDSVSHRLSCDMRSIKNIKKLTHGRGAFIVPHSDWFSEHRLSVDLGLPILGPVNTTEFQSRGRIKEIFCDAGVAVPIGTNESRDPIQLCRELKELIKAQPSAQRFMIRHGFSPNDSSIAYGVCTPGFLAGDGEPLAEVRKAIHCKAGTSRAEFFRTINLVGAIAEIVPFEVLAFPCVALFLSGDSRIDVIGTYDRLHHDPFQFSAALVPECCVDFRELLGHAKSVGSVLLKRGVIGFVNVDFMVFEENGHLMLMGFDIRINTYPSLLMSTFVTTCSGYNPETGKLAITRHIGEPAADATRHVVIMNSVTHPGMGCFSMRDIRKHCHGEGLFFDLLTRTGFKLMFFDVPGNAKNFAIMSAISPEMALLQMETAMAFLLRTFGPKAGHDGACSLTNGIRAVRKFRERASLT